MRECRYRRANYDARDRQRVSSEAPRRRTLSWVHASILAVALVTAVTAWLSGFFDSILDVVVPSGSEAFCVLRETLEYRWPFAPRPAVSDRFSILIATMDHDDTDHTYTRGVREAFLKQDDINHIETCQVLRLSNGARDAEIFAVTTARKWLEDKRADLLVKVVAARWVGGRAGSKQVTELYAQLEKLLSE